MRRVFGDLIAWYLFLGGAGAGLSGVLAALDLARAWRLRPSAAAPAPAWTACLTRRFFTRGYLVALAVLGVGAACLLVDLGRPERFFYVLVHPTASLLTFGSYVLTGTVACAAALGAVALFNLERVPVRVVHLLEGLCVAAALCTMLYTGLFLADIDFVALWRNPALPALFTASALSAGAVGACGLALLESDGRPTPLARLLARADAAAVLAEAACLAAYLGLAWLLAGPDALAPFLEGPYALLFWAGFAGIGVALPLAIEAAYTRIGSAALLALAVPCVLAGGFILRYCVVNVPVA